VENITDYGDMSFSLTRGSLQAMCAGLLTRLKNELIQALLAQCSLETCELVEVLGGGSRMQVVQAVILEVLGDGCHNILGAKMDDGSIALGGTLLANAGAAQSLADAAGADSAARGQSDEQVAALVSTEQAQQKQDADIALLLAARNDMEGYLLDCRGYPRRPFGGPENIDAALLNATLDEYEQWMWDKADDAGLQDITEKFGELKSKVQKVCEKFLAAVSTTSEQSARVMMMMMTTTTVMMMIMMG